MILKFIIESVRSEQIDQNLLMVIKDLLQFMRKAATEQILIEVARLCIITVMLKHFK